MGKTSEKLSYLNGTKRLLRRRLNSLGAEITLETKFRDYLLWLNRFYKAASAPFTFELKGKTTLTPTLTSTNILPLESEEIVTNGVTVTISDGGKLTINGTPTSDMWVKLTNGMDVVYEEPPITQPLVYKNHPWASETLLEYDELKDLYLYIAKGGGTAPNISSGYDVFFVYSDNDSYWNTSSQRSIINFIPGSQTPEKRIIASTTNSVRRLNCIYIYLRENVAYNLYGYLEISETSQTTWTPNRETAGPTPDNPMTITNLTGNITYEASDGTEFPISLGAIELGSIPNGLYDSIYYENGKFYWKPCIGKATFDTTTFGETWYYYSNDDVYNGGSGDYYYGSQKAICNRFKCIVNPNITDSASAGTYLNDYELALQPNDNDLWLKYSGFDEDDPNDTAYKFKEWLSTHPIIIQYEREEELIEADIEEITEEYYPTLYAQLQAIKDYETQLIIEEKIF